jgi:hypothetical protein
MRRLVLISVLLLPGAAQGRTNSAAQTSISNLRLPQESAGIDGIIHTLVSEFDQVDIVALGEAHQAKPDSDFRIALVRSPEFAKKVHSIAVEFASTTEQSTLDRYIRGEDVPPAQLEQIWKTTTQAPNGICESPAYLEFFKAVRDVNSYLPPEQRIRVFGGDPGPGDNRARETAVVDVIETQVLQKHGKALVIYGAAHFYRALPPDYLASMGEDVGIVTTLERDYPGQVLSVIRIGWLDRSRPVAVDVPPDVQKFDRAIKTPVRPVLLSLKQPPFQDFKVAEFLGRTVTTCRPPGGCRSAFKGSTLTLGQFADACVDYGGSPDIDTQAKADR